ncbi:ABC transporter [Planomonospora parontospora subsp. parontospora]|uniref:ABC transporter n=2 Tax=Planomonospora parontospora TaxID=58119 RepID=A0AA37BFT1_9ACTN|nr:ABC transporter permease [Planomonospora parontospora]GGK63974.1 ABC transporter [Planomonospora parontospora]GII08144.1 ABC transporter [Planomonospora parontospora subsp. parontospora]
MGIGDLGRAAAAEWTKLWSVRSTWWCLAGTVVLMVLSALTLGGATATEMLRDGGTASLPAGEPVVSATIFAQFAPVAAAMLMITSEYSSGGVRTTLQAVPVRGRMLAAKALVAAAVAFTAGVVSGGAAAAAVHVVLSGEPFGGHVTLPPVQTALDLLGVGLFFALVSVITVGVGAAMRSAAGTLTAVFMLLMGLPLLLAATGAPPALEVALRMPLPAGLAFMGSTDNPTGGPIPYPAGEGLAWLLAWTAAAVAAGHAVLRRRDA